MLLILFVLACMSVNGQSPKVLVTATIKNASTNEQLSFVNIILRSQKDSSQISGTVTDEKGRFKLDSLVAGKYYLVFNYVGFQSKYQQLIVGDLNSVIDLGDIFLQQESQSLQNVTVSATSNTVIKMEKKSFNLADNISQAGGSVLEAIKNLPGITSGQDGKLQLRGSDKVLVLIDGKQTALTGFGGQNSLDNIPASAIEKVEIINNPSSKYDANGNAGIVNIIFKKEKKQGFNGKMGFSGGLGAIRMKEENLPGIGPQYRNTPKINPSLSVNYRKNKINLFIQADDLYTKTLNKNEFVDRYYDNGDTVKQQTKRNRTTNLVTVKSGIDWFANSFNTFSLSALYSSEKIIDRGDEPFFDAGLKQQYRLWQFLEDELKTTVTVFSGWQHKFAQPGRTLNANFNYTFHREDEKYYFRNTMPQFVGLDSFKLLSDEHVQDFTLDYVQPLKFGRFESGLRFRNRFIPVNMLFKPGINSPLDTSAGGQADYREIIPAFYGNYVMETRRIELEAGVRFEYASVKYEVNPGHPVYKSDSYSYLQPFGNLRLAYKIDENNKISLFYTRRIDRPNEVDIRIFPKYDDAEIIKVGNPALRPQFTNSLELGYKTNWINGSMFSSLYHKRTNGTITRIGSIEPGSNLIYNIYQNAGKSNSTGVELLLIQKLSNLFTINVNMNGYRNVIDSFTVINYYPVENIFSDEKKKIWSGSVKINNQVHFRNLVDAQLMIIYFAPDLVPQGKIYSRFSVDLGVKKTIQKGNGEIFFNATDIAGTFNSKRNVKGAGFSYISKDYYETQVFRIGYNFKF